MKNNSDVAM